MTTQLSSDETQFVDGIKAIMEIEDDCGTTAMTWDHPDINRLVAIIDRLDREYDALRRGYYPSAPQPAPTPARHDATGTADGLALALSVIDAKIAWYDAELADKQWPTMGLGTRDTFNNNRRTLVDIRAAIIAAPQPSAAPTADAPFEVAATIKCHNCTGGSYVYDGVPEFCTTCNGSGEIDLCAADIRALKSYRDGLGSGRIHGDFMPADLLMSNKKNMDRLAEKGLFNSRERSGAVYQITNEGLAAAKSLDQPQPPVTPSGAVAPAPSVPAASVTTLTFDKDGSVSSKTDTGLPCSDCDGTGRVMGLSNRVRNCPKCKGRGVLPASGAAKAEVKLSKRQQLLVDYLKQGYRISRSRQNVSFTVYEPKDIYESFTSRVIEPLIEMHIIEEIPGAFKDGYDFRRLALASAR